jgi:hypothetical protein
MYLKRFNEKMIKVEELLESIALEALIRGGREHVIWIKIYAFTNKSQGEPSYEKSHMDGRS